jgi:hypothetical protein
MTMGYHIKMMVRTWTLRRSLELKPKRKETCGTTQKMVVQSGIRRH